MMKKLTRIFVFIQTLLYFVFLFLDITGGSRGLSTGLKYSIILLCFLYILLAVVRSKENRFRKPEGNSSGKSNGNLYRENHENMRWGLNPDIYLLMGLVFTVIADLFLLVLNSNYQLGVFSFIIVQFLYGTKLEIEKIESSNQIAISHVLKRVIRHRILPCIIITTGISIIFLLLNTQQVIFLIMTTFYFVSILFNTLDALRLAANQSHIRKHLLFAAGMILFVLCDINVGLYNMKDYLMIPEKLDEILQSLSSLLMWTFYAPSQVLIALSSGQFGKISQKN